MFQICPRMYIKLKTNTFMTIKDVFSMTLKYTFGNKFVQKMTCDILTKMPLQLSAGAFSSSGFSII